MTDVRSVAGTYGRLGAARPRVVLVVGDDGSVRRLLPETNRQVGYDAGPLQVLTGRDVEGALRILRQVVPDLVLVALDVPGISALELCRWVRTHPQLRAVPVVALTGPTADDPRRQQATDPGCAGFLRTPVTRADLLQTLRACLDPGAV